MENPKSNDFDNSNIFDELTQDMDLENSVKEMKKEEEKDLYYYLSFYSWIFKGINYIFLIIIILSFSYFYIQKSDKLYQNSYLNLFCPVFLWDASSYVDSTWENCSSVEAFKQNFETNTLSALKKEQYSKIVSVLPDVYTLDNLPRSKEVSFLLDKTQDRLKVTTILSEFDKLRNLYDSVDKTKIVCSDISIDIKNTLKASCSAFSSDWDEGILWYDWKDKNAKVNWTSIAVANSFLNYIQTTSNNFTLINKQKTFSLETVTWNWFYTSKTNFSLELKYNWNNLSF